ncbi:hypothetical protein E8E14_004282 [Neopestalotiopsis sp. 37M]|nr:hypothetical protein E8E14_004282 [Neopestalotiopsis sp. 37M]
MANHNDSARSRDNASNILINHLHDLSQQPTDSPVGRGRDGYELQPLDNKGVPDRREISDSQQSPFYIISHSLDSATLETLSPGQTHKELRPNYRATSAESQSTIIQGDESQESLLGGHEGLAPRRQSTVTQPRYDAFAEPPIDHLAAHMSVSLKPQPIRTRYFAHRYWAWEISASILSISCIVSIVGVLIHEQNKPLSQWGFGQRYLSPNVVVSFLGTLGKSACLVAVAEIVSQLKWMHYQNSPQKLIDLQLFDDASRGPWGALQLAIRKNMKTFLATCASIIAIACLLIDPFIQSVFNYPSILTPVQGQNPTILSSQSYGLSSNQTSDPCGSLGVRTALQGAVLRPIYGATTEAYLPCSFERCEWPTITTLGVCSNCIDLTDTIQSTCDYTASITEDYRYYDLDCNYTFPRVKDQSESATLLEAWWTSKYWLDSPSAATLNTSIVWNSTTENVLEIPMNSSTPALVSKFAFVQFDLASDWAKNIPDGLDTLHNATRTIAGPPVKEAGQCTMQLCAKTFETPYYGNLTASPLTGSQANLVASGISDWSTEILSLNVEHKSESSIPKDTIFRISNCDYMSLLAYLQELFSVSVWNTGDMTVNAPRINAVPIAGVALSKVDNIPALVGQIADSLTEEIRTSADSFSTNGVGMNSEVFIVIDWVWLALPISVTVLTFALLLVVIITNHARGVPPWRSSSLALLFHEVVGWDSSKMVVSGPEDMAARAKEMTAQVTYEEHLLVFSKAG